MISIIIPTLNEAESLPGLLASLSRSKVAHEVIVCDGGSSDKTVSIAQNFNTKVLTSAPGRGIQLSAGTSISNGELILFLHADTRLHSDALERLETILIEKPDIVGGNFRVFYDDKSPFCRFVEFLCRSMRTIGMYYGDSGIFVRRHVYDAIGGIRPIEIMEDVDFVLRLEKSGKTCCISDIPLTTSTRRFKRSSPLSLIIMWVRMHILFACGVSTRYLARIYDARNTNNS
jgi:rSAM/selenodomain-associated transferase 2